MFIKTFFKTDSRNSSDVRSLKEKKDVYHEARLNKERLIAQVPRTFNGLR